MSHTVDYKSSFVRAAVAKPPKSGFSKLNQSAQNAIWARRDDNGIWVPTTTDQDSTNPAGPPPSAVRTTTTLGTGVEHVAGHTHTKRTSATVPTRLLEAEGVSPQARILSRLTGRGLETMRRAMHDLWTTGRVRVKQNNTHAPMEFTLANPDRERAENEVAEAEARLQRAEHKGEGLMFGWLDELVDSDDYVDHFRPPFLANAFTGRRMEHYGTTDKYSNKARRRLQRARDDMKYGECERRGITVVIVRAGAWTRETMLSKVEGLLPLRDLTRHRRVIDFLERVSRGYRRKAGVD